MIEPLKLGTQLEIWKLQGRSIAVSVSANDESTSEGEVYVEDWSHTERLRRSLKFLWISWGLAAGALFIPLLHFILVPSLILVGPIVAYFVYQQTSTVLGGSTSCPKCKSYFEIIRSKEQWPLHDVCSKCYANVEIQKKVPR